MKYGEYGTTGETVSAIGFGGMRFDIANSDEENAELLVYAQEKGINYFDTAPGYFEGRSERIFGIARPQLKEGFYYSTKVSPETEPTAQMAYDSIRRSMDRMKSDYIDFLHLWCIRYMAHYEKASRPGATLEGIQRAHQDGLVKNVCFSSHQQGDGIARVAASGNFRGVLMGMNVLNFPYRIGGARAAREQGLGVAIMNPLGGGQIPQYEQKLSFLASEGRSPKETALRFLLGSGVVTTALVGFTTKEHIDFACRVADEALPLSQAEIDGIAANISESMDSSCTGCGYCLGCPQNINVPTHMLFYNNKQTFGVSEEEMIKAMPDATAFGRLADSVGSAGECIKCGRCENECTQHLPIISRLEEIDKWGRLSQGK